MVISNNDPPKGGRPRPAVDDRLIMPETRYEVIDGEVVYVSPAEYPHASRHSKLAALLEAFVADGFDAVCDMLTRTSEKGDMAPDGSIFPLEPDPETDGRQIERLAFEVVSTERLGHAAKKAAALRSRGVERVFAIDVERKRLLEWSLETDSWSMLLTSDHIEDVCLVAPLPIAALVGAASEDDAMAQALIAKKNPVMMRAVAKHYAEGRDAGRVEGKVEGKLEGKVEGKLEGKLDALLAVMAARGLALTAAQHDQVRTCTDGGTIERWLIRAIQATDADEVFAATP